MPYLRITCSVSSSDRFEIIANRLTETINDLFYNSRGRVSREELRSHTTVHFIPFADGEFFIGGKAISGKATTDITVELSDWSMSTQKQRKVALTLTPVLAELFSVPATKLDEINIRFHSYPPTDFSVGGQLLSDRIPRIGQLAKRFFN